MNGFGLPAARYNEILREAGRLAPVAGPGVSLVRGPAGASLSAHPGEDLVVGHLEEDLGGGLYRWRRCALSGTSWSPIPGAPTLDGVEVHDRAGLAGKTVRMRRDGSSWYFAHACVCPDEITDLSGCCAYLPEANIVSDLLVTTYDDFGTPIGSGTFESFAYRPGAAQIYQAAGAFSSGGGTYLAADGYYIAGPLCIANRLYLCINYGGGVACFDYIFTRRWYAVLACTTRNLPMGVHPDADLMNAPQVRLFLLSNFGTQVPTGETPSETCDDPPYVEGGFRDPSIDFLWEENDPGPDLIRADYVGVYGAISTRLGTPDFEAGGIASQCGPLCYGVNGGIPIPFGTAAVVGTIGAEPCTVPDDDDGCWTTITLAEYCPEDCPDTTGPLWSIYAKDVISNEVFGPGIVTWRANDDTGQCLSTSATVRVRVPIDAMTGGPFASREFAVEIHKPGDAPEIAAHVTVEDCKPVLSYSGIPPDIFQVKLCLTGCPEGGIPGARITAQLWSSDEEIQYAGHSADAGPDGCATLLLPLPATGGAYLLRIISDPSLTGYAIGTHDFPVSLPPAGSACYEVDLGDVQAAIDPAFVCKCVGPVERCLMWTGTGPAVELIYDDGDDVWRGEEAVPDAIGSADDICGSLLPTGTAPIFVELRVAVEGGVCTWLARRTMPICRFTEVDGDGEFTGFGPPKLAWDPGYGTIRQTRAIVAATVYGPAGEYVPPNLSAPQWTYIDGTPDPFATLAPPEGYATADALPCGGGGTMLMALAPGDGEGPGPSELSIPEPSSARTLAPEPPLPPASRQAANLAGAVARTVARVARGGRPSASPEEQGRRWDACRGCDHFRPSDRRCGKIDGCGCWLAKKIPLAAERCPIGKWEPEPISRPGEGPRP